MVFGIENYIKVITEIKKWNATIYSSTEQSFSYTILFSQQRSLHQANQTERQFSSFKIVTYLAPSQFVLKFENALR